MSSNLEKLKNTNLELKEMINNSWDGIAIIDSKSKLIFINDAFLPMLGFKKAELLAKYMTEFMYEEYIDSFLDLLSHNKEDSYFTDLNIACKRKDEKPIYLKVTVSLMLNKKYFVLNAKDITKEISDSEILNNYVISSHTDINGIITDVSDAFCKLSGYEKEELIGKSHSIIKHPDSQNNIFDELWTTVKNGNEWAGKIKNKKKNGDIFWVDVKIKPINNKYGDIIGYTSLMFDITNELLLDQKVTDQDYKINVMNETIKTISHEWRQPLNSISLLAQKLSLELDDNKKLNDVAMKIKNSVSSLSNTIEEFRSLVELKGDKEHINIRNIFETVIKPYKNLAHFSLDIGKNIVLFTYEDRLLTVLNNIFQNSIEAFMKNSIEDKEVYVKVENLDDELDITIIDNAGGIDKENLKKVFEPYFSTKEQMHGVGLGLYITKTLLELHLNGVININSEDEVTTVSIKIKKGEVKL